MVGVFFFGLVVCIPLIVSLDDILFLE